MNSTISDIIHRLHTNQYPNEQAIKQGIVLRLLVALGWDVYDPQTVKPELNVSGGFVDFALFYPISKPQIFIEVKQSTTFNIGEDQLMMRYAFQHGVPIAILTDGRRWSFYLPGGNGTFEERRFYHLDLLEREIEEVESRLWRYLSFEEVKSNRAFDAARSDHDNAARQRAILKSLPSAWKEIVQEADSRLVDALLEKVETTTGYRPQLIEVEQFLKQLFTTESTSTKPKPTIKPKILPIVANSETPPLQIQAVEKKDLKGENWYSINGVIKLKSSKAIDITEGALKSLFAIAPQIPEEIEKEIDLANQRKGRKTVKRRWLARTREDLYVNPNMHKNSIELISGWWLGTNYSNDSKKEMLEIAGKIAARHGIKLEFNLV